jgi:hypothetical protein
MVSSVCPDAEKVVKRRRKASIQVTLALLKRGETIR